MRLSFAFAGSKLLRTIELARMRNKEMQLAAYLSKTDETVICLRRVETVKDNVRVLRWSMVIIAL
jgi:hypothetical protein